VVDPGGITGQRTADAFCTELCEVAVHLIQPPASLAFLWFPPDLGALPLVGTGMPLTQVIEPVDAKIGALMLVLVTVVVVVTVMMLMM
jgi:hypothetical protein